MVGVPAFRRREPMRSAEALLPRQADVRRELAARLVTQADADLRVIEARADSDLLVSLPRKVCLQTRLQDQAQPREGGRRSP